MIQGIDHLVIVVKDLDQAAKDYEQLGFTVVPGGKHPVGSHNALISFVDGSYIEIIAFYREAPDHRWWDPLQKGERLVDFCMQTNDLQGDTLKLRAAGVAINDPVPWSRTRPDGYELKWLLSLAQGSHRGVAPFLIQDVTPREERIPQTFNHKNDATGIETVTVTVGELTAVRRWYDGVLGNRPTNISDEKLQANGVRYAIGPHTLDFLMPMEPQSPLINWLRTFGPSPYAATLHRISPGPSAFDGKLTHGANLSFAL
ncbi:MAG TPA: VOC family protein [Candidatus Binatia bacterium]|nr:VOC family protein [Candidatus Binatia bacterium]